MVDSTGRELKDGDIIDIHQTVNGQNHFVVLNVARLDVVYYFDQTRKYEYDTKKLVNEFDFDPFTIIGNIFRFYK